VNFLNIDEEFVSMMDLKIAEGRGFSAEYPADTMNNGIPGGPLDQTIGSILLNETAVRDLGIQKPAVGKQIVWGEDGDTTYSLNIIGVVKDFHFASMRDEIKPFAFVRNPNRQSYFAVKLLGTDLPTTISAIKATWDKNVTTRPFQYHFLDETFDKLYSAEKNFRSVFFYFTLVTIIIACLGLLGLASFVTEQRMKEIGIRKVLGATVQGIVVLVSRDFMKLIVLASIIAAPIAWYSMRRWLENFSYRVSIPWVVFLVAAILAFVIAFLTIGFQAVKAASANPVKNLRSE
jgi:putative ABC transport system permease protein